MTIIDLAFALLITGAILGVITLALSFGGSKHLDNKKFKITLIVLRILFYITLLTSLTLAIYNSNL